MEYRTSGFIPSSFLRWNNTIDNIHRLTEREKVYADELNEKNRPMPVRQEQRSAAPIQKLVKKYTQPVELSVDQFDGSYLTNRVFMLRPEHCRCIVGDKASDCNAHAMAHLVVFCARLFSNDESNITGIMELVQSARVFNQDVGRFNSKKYRSVWLFIDGWPPIHVFTL